MRSRSIRAFLALALALLASETPRLQPAAPSVGAPVVTPMPVPVGQPATVTVTSVIPPSTPPVIPTAVNLLRIGANNQTLGILGTMNDAGTNGDAVAGDRTFTVRVTVTIAPGDQLRVRVSAPFQGVILRVMSGVQTIPIGPADTTPPVVTITAPSGKASLAMFGLITVQGTANDATATVRINGTLATVTNGVFTANGVVLQEGANAITATATDPAGNVGTATARVGLDTQPPALAITTPVAGSSTTQNPPALAVTYADTGSGVLADSLAWTVNGSAIVVACQPVTGGAACAPADPSPGRRDCACGGGRRRRGQYDVRPGAVHHRATAARGAVAVDYRAGRGSGGGRVAAHRAWHGERLCSACDGSGRCRQCQRYDVRATGGDSSGGPDTADVRGRDPRGIRHRPPGP